METGLRGSVATRVRATSPLRLLTPQNTGSAAWVYASTYGGGLVDGDHLRLSVDVEPGATLMLSTQASTKVYRSPRGTRSDLDVRIGPDGLCVSLPDPVVCFADAGYRQHQRFDLAPGASLVHVDWLSCGRLGRGERWAFSSYRSSLGVTMGGRLVCRDALTLDARDGALAERLGRFETLATIVLAGPVFAQRADALAEALAAQPVVRQADAVWSVAPFGRGDGVLVRLADSSLERAARTIRRQLDLLPTVLGDDPWARKW